MFDWLFGSKKKKPRLTINKSSRNRPDFPYPWLTFTTQAAKMGYEFNSNLQKRTDLILVFSHAGTTLERIKARQKEGAKVVLRADGIWGWRGGTAESICGHEKTRPTIGVLEIADAVIYQSHFNRDLFHRYLPRPRAGCREYVIYNGANNEIFNSQGPRAEGLGFKHTLVASSWHTNDWKGLDRTIKAFLALSREDVGLLVLGEAEERFKVDHPRIRFLGRLSHPEMAKVYRAADAFIYLPWFDWCPNSVIEAILCGLPVITSNLGGQAEFLGPSGLLIPSIPQRTIEDFFKPAEIDLEAAAKAINTIIEDRSRFIVPRADLYIGTYINNYFTTFKDILGWWDD